MKFSVPFIPDDAYLALLSFNRQRFSSVYYALAFGQSTDARWRSFSLGMNRLIDGIKKTNVSKRYCLLNTRFFLPGLYRKESFIEQLADSLCTLYANDCLSGIVVNDFYFLNALSRRENDFFSDIEVVPGVNCCIDTIDKARAFLEMVDNTRFKMPDKLIVDRSLNRDFYALEKLIHNVRNTWPGMKIELLANEGCIYNCPFKAAHDAHISLANCGFVKNETHSINSTLGCHAYFHKNPSAFLKSPFIRPEDISFYNPFADSIKLCGRTLGAGFMTRCLNAYINGVFKGNLFDLMDAANWLSDHFYLENSTFDPQFLYKITHCTKDCKMCKICNDQFTKAAIRRPLTLKPYKDFE